MKVKDLSIMAILLSLLVVCSKISIQIGPIPITLQTFAVIIIGFILKTKKALILFLTYIIMGIIGIPVFSGGGGFDYLLKPSFGFIIGFLLSALITGINSNKKIFTFIQGFLGLFIIDIFGLLYMYIILNYYMQLDKDIVYVLQAGLTPFILKDSISVLIASLAYVRLKPITNYNYNIIYE